MTTKELNNRLNHFNEQIQEYNPSAATLLSWFWSLFEQIFEGTTEIHYSQIKLFDKYCPNFSENVRCYGITKEASIQNLYAEARKPYYSTIRMFEDAHPDIFYIRATPRSEFIPFGKYETPLDDLFFINALLSDAPTDVEQYNRFKAYIFRCFIHDYQVAFEPVYHYINEDTLSLLEKNYPNLMKKFRDEQATYLDSIGYTSAVQKFKQLQKDEETSLSFLTKDTASTLIEIRIGDNYVPIIYK